MRHLDLFSGIGGFALAVRWLGHETVGFCEIDEWSRRVLDKHWPGVPKHDDIRTLEGTEFGPIDLITGGFPCQPFSVAGQRRGEDDPRHLWPAMHRIIDTARPRFVLAENVAGIVNMALDGVLADLEAIGYAAGAVVIPAGAVNALHRRDRVWIMAYRDEPNGETCSPDRMGAGEQADTLARSGSNTGNTVTVADAGKDGSPRSEHAGESSPEGIRPIGIRAGTSGCSEGMADTEGSTEWKPGTSGRQCECRAGSGCGCESGHMGHADKPRLEGRQFSGQRAGERAVGQAGGEQAGRTEPETPRSVDAGPDGLPPELVRRSWADGTWELDLPRVVTHEPERRQKLQAAGNAIVPQVAYEILRVMIGEAA